MMIANVMYLFGICADALFLPVAIDDECNINLENKLKKKSCAKNSISEQNGNIFDDWQCYVPFRVCTAALFLPVTLVS